MAGELLGELGGAWFILIPLSLLAGLPAGLAAGWLLTGDQDPAQLRAARIRQGQLAGTASGAACGLIVTLLLLGIGGMLVVGPLVGLVGGMAGGTLAADHSRRGRRARPQAAAEAVPGPAS